MVKLLRIFLNINSIFTEIKKTIPTGHYFPLVKNAGDFNGDGFDDIVLGNWMYSAPDGSGYSLGQVTVLSGRDGSILYEKIGTRNNAKYGRDVGAAGDVDLDGYEDLIVCERSESPRMSGRVHVISGKTHEPLFSLVSAWSCLAKEVGARLGQCRLLL